MLDSHTVLRPLSLGLNSRVILDAANNWERCLWKKSTMQPGASYLWLHLHCELLVRCSCTWIDAVRVFVEFEPATTSISKGWEVTDVASWFGKLPGFTPAAQQLGAKQAAAHMVDGSMLPHIIRNQ